MDMTSSKYLQTLNIPNDLPIKYMKYPQLCISLNITPLRGNAKTAQLKELSLYIELELKGTSFKIVKVFETKQEATSSFMAIEKTKKHTLVNLVKVLSYLSAKPEDTNEAVTSYFYRRELFDILGYGSASFYKLADEVITAKTSDKLTSDLVPNLNIYRLGSFLFLYRQRAYENINSLLTLLRKNKELVVSEGYQLIARAQSGVSSKYLIDKEEVAEFREVIEPVRQKDCYKNPATGAHYNYFTLVNKKLLAAFTSDVLDLYDGRYQTYYPILSLTYTPKLITLLLPKYTNLLKGVDTTEVFKDGIVASLVTAVTKKKQQEQAIIVEGVKEEWKTSAAYFDQIFDSEDMILNSSSGVAVKKAKHLYTTVGDVIGDLDRFFTYVLEQEQAAGQQLS
jgi:hypothetical protein